jgi:predicted SAM-dependent methyltransferase
MCTKVHIGCGDDYRDAWINGDIRQSVDPDLVINLETGLPFEDDSVDEVLAKHLLEHIDNLILLIEEIFRILKPGGIFRGEVPHFRHRWAFEDPTHVNFFATKTFEFFTDELNHRIGTDANFTIIGLDLQRELTVGGINLAPKLGMLGLRMGTPRTIRFRLKKP